MIMSMTGYGRAVEAAGGSQITVEMKAVNHRFCEINFRIPRQFMFLEERLKKIISPYVRRGKVDVFIHFQGEGMTKRSLAVDWELLRQYELTFQEMAEKTDSSQTFPADRLLLHEDVVMVQESDEITEAMENLVVSATESAAVQLMEMRRKEGAALYQDLQRRFSSMNQFVQELKEHAPTVQKMYRERLLKRVQEFVADTMDIDESRILTEVAVFADKADIQEELTRMESHLLQFRQVLDQDDVVGRKLDFLVQEMNRETNTIGSKANDISISQIVVNIKAELEKIREQVQNIE
ncbi:TIGR00255 family protein [Evansella caseinilytica]|uniref:TIGR00255 family protein n=1 Tax=Evansella caseinilytica TaxID=1503961 RepID=A0A1H3ME37_9BACI|nr:YicC/YloC family endoribonuclease [Evansella caseinilytica]SDY74578.1 TIGR00255 family protein [Evansella caseinilytica]